jgi:hypothetical protein
MNKYKFNQAVFNAAKEQRGKRIVGRDTPHGREYFCGLQQWSTDRDAAIRYDKVPDSLRKYENELA